MCEYKCYIKYSYNDGLVGIVYDLLTGRILGVRSIMVSIPNSHSRYTLMGDSAW